MKTLSVGAAVVVALLALGGRAADIAVGDGESFALDGANNVAANRLVFPAGAATLTLTGAVTGENALNVQVIAADAAASVTLTVADGVGKTLRFANHVSVKGSLSVSGFDAVKAGNTAVTPATVDAATDLVAPFPAFDVATLATSVTIDGAVQLPRTPAGAGTLTKAATAFLALTGKNALGSASSYTLDCDVMLVHTNAFSDRATINVPNGRTLGYCPLVVASDYTWSYYPYAEKIRTYFSVVLGAGVADATAQFHLWPNNYNTGGTEQCHYIEGAISGKGDVKVLPMRSKGNDKSAHLQYHFRGRQSFVGTLYSKNCNVKFYMGVPADGQVPFNLDLTNIDGITFWATYDSAGWGHDNVYVPQFKSGYYNTTLYPQRGQTVTVGKYYGGGYNVYGVGADLCRFVMLTNGNPDKVLRMTRVSYVLDDKTLEKNNYYEIDSDGGKPRQWFMGNGQTTIANISWSNSLGVGVPDGRTMSITTVDANKYCEVCSNATAYVGTLSANASVRVADTGHAVITNQPASATVTAGDGASVTVATLGDGASVTAGDSATVSVTTLGGNNTVTIGANGTVNVSDSACDTLALNVGDGTAIQFGDHASESPKPTLAPTVVGHGTVIASGCNLNLAKGNFIGTVNLANGTLTLKESVPEVGDLPQTDSILAWFDPSKAVSRGDTRITDEWIAARPGAEQTNEVAWVNDRRGTLRNEFQLASNTSDAYVDGANRRGHLVFRDHITGVAMPWVDCRNYYKEVNSSTDRTLRPWGNAYRFYRYGNSGVLSTSDHSIPFATAFLVQDSTYGGSSPLLDAFSPLPAYNRDTSSPTAKLWGSGVADALKNGSVYVNGKQVADPLTSAEFTGGPEVLSVQTQTDTTFPVKGVGYYGDSEGGKDRSAAYGEILFYGTQLTETERKTVEAYLAWKWNGVLLHDRLYYGVMTLDGATAFSAPTIGKLPQFATTYTGTVTLSQSTLDIALDGEGQTASGGFSIPGTVSLPSSVTVNLTCPAHLHVNTSVKLASWGALGSQTTFTLGTVSGVRRGGLILALRAAQDGLYFDVKGTGTSLFFR